MDFAVPRAGLPAPRLGSMMNPSPRIGSIFKRQEAQQPQQQGGTSAGPGDRVIVVQVSNQDNALAFFPDSVQAPVGSFVQFQFHPNNHSVVESTFDAPCQPINSKDAFFSGFMPTSVATGNSILAFTIKITDDRPRWFYCSQGKHCQKGMVGAINPPPSGEKTVDAFKALAAKQPENMTPPPTAAAEQAARGMAARSRVALAGLALAVGASQVLGLPQMAYRASIPSPSMDVDEDPQWLDAATSNAECVPHFSHEPADSRAAMAVMALAPRALFKFGMDMPHGSNATDLTGTQDDRANPASPSLSHSPTWPILSSSENQNLPHEVYQLICSQLSMEDVKALRLTCKEVNFFIAPILFETTVVPYHMAILERVCPWSGTVSRKGKERRVDADIFGKYGNSIKNFGIRFELPAAILAAPPEKHLLEPRETYWGHYDWPAPFYLRFDHLKDLEGEVDEGFGVREAFSKIRKVEELAISVDNSLGWLVGPDKSIQDMVLNEKEGIVKHKFETPSRKSMAQRKFWKLIESHYPHLASLHRSDLWCSSLHLVESGYSVCCADSSSELPYFSRQLLWEAIGNDMLGKRMPELNSGFLVVSQNTGESERISNHPICPNRLSTRQIELLLENWWIQHAFLTSYIVSVIDILPPSAQVHTLNIARLPADFLQLFCRADFWASLPNLRTLKIFVAGQFREVHLNDFGEATSSYVKPSRAVPIFLHLLKEYISPLPNVTQLSFGWASGGEHEKGLYGRNVHLLPAPFMSEVPSLQGLGRWITFDSVVTFPHVEDLHIKNCWATAEAIVDLARFNVKHRLRRLTLESVSLLGHRAPPTPFALPPAPAAAAAAAANANANAQVQLLVAHGVPNANAHLPARNVPRLLSPPMPDQQIGNMPPGGVPGPQAQVVAPATWMGMQLPPPPAPLPFTGVGQGTWTWVLDIISPSKHLPRPGDSLQWRQDLSLEQLNVISSGYCFLYNYPWRYEDLDPSFKRPYNQTHLARKQEEYVKQRTEALEPLMMPVFDPGLAEIVQVLPAPERDVLETVFQASMGWDDARAAEAACFDHRCEGGTGRFSVALYRGDNAEPESPGASGNGVGS
ncbi:hypothetical protein IWX49DRAFT_588662 [Phyllosticta citricarpa]|uniref:Uncharacterized protein n=1 Tax=Phyllosticta citricarpa TaxID=55181 RepID=A0ABR1MCW7_9PEZI